MEGISLLISLGVHKTRRYNINFNQSIALTIPSLSIVARICSDPGVTVYIDLGSKRINF